MSNRRGENLVHFGGNEKLVRAFVDSGVRFVLVGGLAVSWYCAERTADDMDLLVEPTIENSVRIARALSGLGLHGFTDESFAKFGLQVRLKQGFYAELLTPELEQFKFSEVHARAVGGNLFHIPVRIAAVVDLIAMKERAISVENGQPEKHIEDIELLKQ